MASVSLAGDGRIDALRGPDGDCRRTTCRGDRNCAGRLKRRILSGIADSGSPRALILSMAYYFLFDYIAALFRITLQWRTEHEAPGVHAPKRSEISFITGRMTTSKMYMVLLILPFGTLLHSLETDNTYLLFSFCSHYR